MMFTADLHVDDPLMKTIACSQKTEVFNIS